MRKHIAENEKLFSKYAENLIHNLNFYAGHCDFKTTRDGIDFLIDTQRYRMAEKCLNYHIQNLDFSTNEYFDLICRGLFLCAHTNLGTDKLRHYQKLFSELENSGEISVEKAKNHPLYALYAMLLDWHENAQKYRSQWQTLDDIYELQIQRKFNNFPECFPNFAYYNVMIEAYKSIDLAFLVNLLSEAVAHEKDDETIYKNVVECLISQNQESSTKKAIKILNSLLDKSAFNCELWQKLANIYNDNKQFDEAIKAYKYCEIIDKNNHKFARLIAYCYIEKEDFANGLTYLQKYYEKSQDNNHGQIFMDMGICNFNLGLFDEAIEFFDKFVSVCNERGTNYLDDSNCFLKSKGYNFPIMPYFKCVSLLKLNRPNEAADIYFCIENQECEYTNMKWLTLKAEILLALDKREQAEHFLIEITNKNQYNAYTLKQLIEMFINQGSYLIALIYIKLLKSFNKERANAMVYESVIEYKFGNIDNAAIILNAAQDIDPLALPNFKSYCPESVNDYGFFMMIK